MSEREGQLARHESEPKAKEPEILLPDDAYVPTERVIGALAAAESARQWLGEHPERSFGAAPPGDSERPRPVDLEDIDALIEEATALTKAASDQLEPVA